MSWAALGRVVVNNSLAPWIVSLKRSKSTDSRGGIAVPGGQAHEDEANTSRALDAVMRELRIRPRELWLDLARSDQSDRWRRGIGVQVEAYLAQLPELEAQAEEALVLICG